MRDHTVDSLKVTECGAYVIRPLSILKLSSGAQKQQDQLCGALGTLRAKRLIHVPPQRPRESTPNRHSATQHTRSRATHNVQAWQAAGGAAGVHYLQHHTEIISITLVTQKQSLVCYNHAGTQISLQVHNGSCCVKSA